MLTVEMLQKMKPRSIFAFGVDPQLGLWVAVRGGVADWAIYHRPGFINLTTKGLDETTVYAAEIADAAGGEKLYSRERAQWLLAADDDAAARYRK